MLNLRHVKTLYVFVHVLPWQNLKITALLFRGKNRTMFVIYLKSYIDFPKIVKLEFWKFKLWIFHMMIVLLRLCPQIMVCFTGILKKKCHYCIILKTVKGLFVHLFGTAAPNFKKPGLIFDAWNPLFLITWLKFKNTAKMLIF